MRIIPNKLKQIVRIAVFVSFLEDALSQSSIRQKRAYKAGKPKLIMGAYAPGMYKTYFKK
jgi:hypothetical protein